MRQRQAEGAHHEGGAGGEEKWGRGRLHPHVADGQADGNPADGAEHADKGELAAGVGQLAKREGVGERDSGEVAEAVHEHQGIDRRKICDARDEIQKECPNQMQHREHFLRGKKAVGNQPDEERRDHAGQRRGSEDRAGLGSGELQRHGEVRIEGDVPRPPYDEVQEHHQAQARLEGNGHTCSVTKKGESVARPLRRAGRN